MVGGAAYARRWLRRAAWGAIAAALLAAALGAGCATLMGMEYGKPLPEAGVGASGGGGSGGGGGEPCEHAAQPSPPGVVDAGDGPEFVVALRSIHVDSQPDGGAVGLDLDVTCTCQGEGPSCAHPSDDDDCDLSQGRDNALVAVLQLFGAGLGLDDVAQYFTDRAEAGLWSLLLRVRGYNGELDDDRVEVAWFQPAGFGDAGAPAWEGSDPWPIADTSLQPAADGGLDVEHPRFVDHHAYVTGGVLVVRLPDADLVLRGSAAHLAVSLTGAIVVGRLEPAGGRWALRDALVAGRLVEQDVFRAVSSMRATSGEPLCVDDPAYLPGKTEACASLDILAQPGVSTQPCDALSAGIAFEAEPAAIGPVQPPPALGPGCDSSVDPIHDSCP